MNAMGRSDRVDNYRLAINPAGSRALHACLPEPSWRQFVATAGRRGGGFGFLDPQLHKLVVIEDAIMYPPDANPAEIDYPVDRSTLRAVLLDGLDDVVQYGKRFDRYEFDADGRPVASFADGTSAAGDVLVGADGAGSRVRAQLLPNVAERDLDTVGIGMKLPLTDATREWLPRRLAAGMNLVVTGRPYFLFTSVFERREPVGDDYLLCAFVARRGLLPEHPTRLTGSELHAVVGHLTTSWHPDLRRLVGACDPGSIAAFTFAATQSLPRWEPGAVTVLGDGAHMMPPAGGNGANTALRDAHLLTLELSAPPKANGPYWNRSADTRTICDSTPQRPSIWPWRRCVRGSLATRSARWAPRPGFVSAMP